MKPTGPPTRLKPTPAAAAPRTRALPGRGRRIAFRLIALFLVPLLLLGAAEAVLRIAGYGYRTGFFIPARVENKDVLVNNETFSYRFFPPALARWPTPIVMSPDKAPQTFRIFIFGESAAQGDPEPAFGAGRYLTLLLQDRYPGARFEVINTGVTAINSHVIVPIARECARYHGDVWIVYMGNNEMVGPFGAATIFGSQAPPLWLVRLNLAAQQTRLGQFVMAAGRHLKGRSADASWGGMQMFLGNQLPARDRRRDAVYANFEQNLADIVDAGLRSGAKVLLSPVLVNLKDSPPFASMSDPAVAPADRDAADDSFRAGCKAQAAGDGDAAAAAFQRAARLDSGRADIEYHLAQSLAPARPDEALKHYQAACDLDALPFRADSRVNDIITRAGAGRPGVTVLNLDALRKELSPDGIPGDESFYEHVHFNFDGSYRLALAWARAIVPLLPPTLAGQASGEWTSQAECERQLGLTEWNRSLVLRSVLQRFNSPPLSTQPNNPARVAAIEPRVKMPAPEPAAVESAKSIARDALRRRPDDHFLHENNAELLQCLDDVNGAAAEWRRVAELLPQDCLARFQLGRLLSHSGKPGEAEPILAGVVAVRPNFVEAWMALGEACFAQGRYEQARQAYETAHRLRPRDPQSAFELGRTCSLLKQSDQSIAWFQECLRLNPDYWQAHYALGGELGAHDRITEARDQFIEVVRRAPGFAPGHLNLGVACLKLGDATDARREFEATLKLDPSNTAAREYLKMLSR
ncbi:MAG: tetratricopeptide repeat protein [Verrucomicrobiota bacterium]